MYLLRKHLGSDGWQADLIVHRLGELAPALGAGGTTSLGLEAEEIDRLHAEFDLAEAGRRLHVVHGLRGTAWWGSALADIACSTQPAASLESRPIMVEGALFHLAFQLFDIVVDREPRGVSALAEALRPELLARRLSEPGQPTGRLSCEATELNVIVRLFDAGLVSLGHRLAGEPGRLEAAASLLERMYRSELRISSDPFEAKELPAQFVGLLAIPLPDTAAHEMMSHLSTFISLCDDWADLLEDMIRGAPNAFLSSDHPSMSRRRATYVGRSALRLVAGRRMHGAIAERLAEPLTAALESAEKISPTTYDKVLGLCRRSLGKP